MIIIVQRSVSNMNVDPLINRCNAKYAYIQGRWCRGKGHYHKQIFFHRNNEDQKGTKDWKNISCSEYQSSRDILKNFILIVYWYWFSCTLSMSCRFYIIIYRQKWKYSFCWQMVLQNKCNLYFIWVGPVFCLATPKVIDWLPINFIRRKKSWYFNLPTS